MNIDLLFKIGIRAIAAIAIYLTIKQVTHVLSKRLERFRSDRNLFSFWVHESASDVGRLGHGIAATIAICIPLMVTFPSVVKIGWDIIMIQGVITLGLFGITGLTCTEIWLKSHINPDIDPRDRQFYTTSISLLCNLAKYGCYIVGLLAICTILGFDLSAVFTGSAVAFLVFGIAAQLLLQDIFSGWAIIVERIYYEGSEICIIMQDGKEICGIVSRMTFRLTWIEQKDGSQISFANRTLERIRVVRK